MNRRQLDDDVPRPSNSLQREDIGATTPDSSTHPTASEGRAPNTQTCEATHGSQAAPITTGQRVAMEQTSQGHHTRPDPLAEILNYNRQENQIHTNQEANGDQQVTRLGPSRCRR